MSEPGWETVAEPATEAEAQILVGLLRSESVPARLKANIPVPGLGLSFLVQVPPDFVVQAGAVLNSPAVSEDELTQLASESPPPEDS